MGRPKSKLSYLRILLCYLLLIIFLHSCADVTNPSNIAFDETETGSLYSSDMELKTITLKPNEIEDIFPNTTYAIEQPVSNGSMVGLRITYPTRVIEHTSAFVEGFSTAVYLYNDKKSASEAFDTISQNHNSEPISLLKISSQAGYFSQQSIAPGGELTGSSEYIILIVESNALLEIVIRSDEDINADQIENVASQALAKLKAHSQDGSLSQ